MEGRWEMNQQNGWSESIHSQTHSAFITIHISEQMSLQPNSVLNKAFTTYIIG